VRVGVAATPYVAIPTLDWLLRSSHDLALVITRPNKPAGRGRTLQESAVAKWASSHDVECIKPVASADLLDSLALVDLVITLGYGVILPVQILAVPRYGFINLHFSLLPAWRGAAPVQRAILQGDQLSGVTVFALDAGMDTGPIYLQRSSPIGPYENAGEVLMQLAELGPEVVAESIEMINAGVAPQVQRLDGVSYAKKAFTPEPGSWTRWKDSTLQVTQARPFPSNGELTPGGILIENGNVIVGCGEESAVILEEVTPAGKRAMSAKNWTNGARIAKGDRFV
jgi:methionyl-tRNA formyltransferase